MPRQSRSCLAVPVRAARRRDDARPRSGRAAPPPTTEHEILGRRRPSRLLAVAVRMSFVACTGAVTRPALAHAFLVSVDSIESIDLQGGYALRRDPRLAGVLPVCSPAQRMRCRETATEIADLQARCRDGSDGTRTRDLRRDRPAF